MNFEKTKFKFRQFLSNEVQNFLFEEYGANIIRGLTVEVLEMRFRTDGVSYVKYNFSSCNFNGDNCYWNFTGEKKLKIQKALNDLLTAHFHPFGNPGESEELGLYICDGYEVPVDGVDVEYSFEDDDDVESQTVFVVKDGGLRYAKIRDSYSEVLDDKRTVCVWDNNCKTLEDISYINIKKGELV